MKITCTLKKNEEAYPYLLEEFTRSADSDPVRLAMALMDNEAVRIHGPEHHFLTSGALIAACCEAEGRSEEKRRSLLEKALVRAKGIPMGICGFSGVCGAVLAAGNAVSLLYQINSFSGEPLQRLSRITAACQEEMAKSPGPRCCKRAILGVLWAASRGMREEFGCLLSEGTPPVCRYYRQNTDCLGKQCRFHPVGERRMD